MNFCKVWRLCLKKWARHANFNFEIPKDVAASIFESHPPNFDQMCIFYSKQMMFSSFVYIFYRIPAILKKLIFFVPSGPHDAQIVHHGGHSEWKKSVSMALSEYC